MELTKSYLKDLTYKVTGTAIEVHKRLGPGLSESIYRKCLEKKLEIRAIRVVSEHSKNKTRYFCVTFVLFCG